MPRKLCSISGAAWLVVSATTSSACASWSVSIRSVVVVRSLKTPTMSYADSVRSTRDHVVLVELAGAGRLAASRYFSPSRLSTSIDARLSLPNSTPLSTSKVTSDGVAVLERDVLDPADADAADLHHVARRAGRWRRVNSAR